MNEPIQTSKRELTVFFLVAFAVPYLMGVPLAIAQRAGLDTSCFANSQMMYPAAGVMLAYLAAKRRAMPLRFFVLHLFAAILCVAASLFSVVYPSDTLWLSVINVVLVIGSLLAWIFLLTDKKEKRTIYGLRWRGKGLFAFGICALFLLLKTAIIFVSVALEGETAWHDYLAYWASFVPWMYAAILIPNFFLSFLPFFGEEYGWRYYLTPVLQKRFGKRRGVLLLGILWGLWHLPLNLFFYSPQTSFQSLIAQIITCITAGIFFTFAYEVCDRNIWVPVLLHYLNNNMILVWSGTAEISNQVYSWADIGLTAVLYGIVFIPFLSSKVFRQPASD
ncbi:CPBP family intramembrane glutamic endopeptidase [Subdoligranulum variabile]|uniref:CAAX amino terminal protease family protein n=1 Tax=Subdoligranulum variabile DSM 15176 TaxID=411471 RepID=D1PKS8_9FIRM|nr:CPBP family intramembrane glutamic endopeptidase [Subdoligranulum variabile]EFB76586.1 CAAX amino terminal protease family protein [Subdoligranulum variabile DSM 15176]UWP68179.1 CPBP family glutamic-type intramembrane protease [Subdoligranulum variabile]